jgi:hypothetical protein
MAVTDIQATVSNLTGVSPSANTVEDAQKFVVASVPKDLLSFAQKVSSPSNDGSAISFSVNDSITDVQRNGYSCREIPMRDAVWALDDTSLRYATSKHPVFYHKQGGVYFAPITDGNNAGYVFYVDYSLIDDDCDLRNAVIYRASAAEFEKLATSKVTDWSDLTLPVAPPAPSFGSDLSISSSAPVAPILSDSTVSFSTTAPTYLKPIISLGAAPSISDLTISAVAPVAPSLTDTTVTESSITEPSFTPPVMSAPDFGSGTGTEGWITTEEDSEMLAARVQEIQAKIGEYSARMGEAQAQFNKDNAIFQKDIQIAIQNAQIESAEDGIKLQKFSNEVQQYQAEVNRQVQEYQQNLAGDLQVWQAERTTDLQKYGSDIQDALNSFNKENAEYQAQLQISVQDAQLSSQDDAQKIQKYGAEVGTYQHDMNKEIQDFVNTLQKESQEYQSKVALYNSELQKYQAGVSEKTAKVGSATQNAAYYSKEADKYYQWANAEVQMYIQNNSKMINKTIAAQAAAQQQRR